VILCNDELANLLLEARSPVIGLDGVPAPGICVQVVHDVSAADDQHARIAQQPHVAQHGPRAVIEAPALVENDVERREQLPHLACKSGIAWRGILDSEQLARKAAEIVDRAWRGHRRDAELRQVPVRRDAQDRAWPRQVCAERSPGAGVAVVSQRIHGIAVTEEDRGQARIYRCHGCGIITPLAISKICTC
jgi:hypothetical protein